MAYDNGKFLRISCSRCGQNKIIFGKSASNVKCDKCNKRLIKLTGGKSVIKTNVRAVLGE